MLEEILKNINFAEILKKVFHKNREDLNLSETWRRTLHKVLENPESRKKFEDGLVEAILEEAKSRKIET